MIIRIFLFNFLLLFSFAAFAQETFTDPRDGTTYQIKTYTRSVGMDVIVSHTWMIENLRFEIADSYCYDNDPANCKKYGRLYTWQAARMACPTGWHLATDLEWQRLMHQFSIDGTSNRNRSEVIYGQLIKGGPSNFSAQLGGGWFSSKEFLSLSAGGGYWSTAEQSGDVAWYYFFSQSDSGMRRLNENKRSALSCRCVKD